jgi:hypothetical protein
LPPNVTNAKPDRTADLLNLPRDLLPRKWEFELPSFSHVTSPRQLLWNNIIAEKNRDGSELLVALFYAAASFGNLVNLL